MSLFHLHSFKHYSSTRIISSKTNVQTTAVSLIHHVDVQTTAVSLIHHVDVQTTAVSLIHHVDV